jgi:hypothetical protein
MTETIRSKQYADAVSLEDEDPIDFTIPRCVPDRDEALAIIREDHEQWLREGAPMDAPALGTSQSTPQSGS